MKCPECGAWTRVVETREVEGTLRRRRECGNEHRTTTYEVTDAEFRTLYPVRIGRPPKKKP